MLWMHARVGRAWQRGGIPGPSPALRGICGVHRTLATFVSTRFSTPNLEGD